MKCPICKRNISVQIEGEITCYIKCSNCGTVIGLGNAILEYVEGTNNISKSSLLVLKEIDSNDFDAWTIISTKGELIDCWVESKSIKLLGGSFFFIHGTLVFTNGDHISFGKLRDKNDYDDDDFDYEDCDREYEIVDLRNGLYKITDGTNYGLLNDKGECIIKPVYEKILPFNGDILFVKYCDSWRIIDNKGFFLSDLYPIMRVLSDNLFVVGFDDEKLGLINRYGNVVQPFVYSKMYTLKNGRARVMRNGKYGYLNKKGDLIIETIYDLGKVFFNGHAKVMLNGSFFLIDKNGLVVEEITEYEFDGIDYTREEPNWKEEGILEAYNGDYGGMWNND